MRQPCAPPVFSNEHAAGPLQPTLAAPRAAAAPCQPRLAPRTPPRPDQPSPTTTLPCVALLTGAASTRAPPTATPPCAVACCRCGVLRCRPRSPNLRQCHCCDAPCLTPLQPSPLHPHPPQAAKGANFSMGANFARRAKTANHDWPTSFIDLVGAVRVYDDSPTAPQLSLLCAAANRHGRWSTADGRQPAMGCQHAVHLQVPTAAARGRAVSGGLRLPITQWTPTPPVPPRTHPHATRYRDRRKWTLVHGVGSISVRV